MRIPILTQRDYDFSNLAAGAQSDTVLVKALDVSAYRSGSVRVRVHQADYGANTPTLKVVAYITAPSADEPDVDFVGDAHATVTLKDATTTVSAGQLAIKELNPSFGSHLRVVLEATQASPADTLTATISAEMALDEEP